MAVAETTAAPGGARPGAGGAPERDPRRAELRLDRLATYGPLAALVVLVAGFSALEPQFATLGNLRNVLDAASVLAVMTVGLTFVLLMGAIDLSVEGVAATVTMATALLVANSRTASDLGLLGAVAGIGVGAALGLGSGLLSTRLRIPSFMTTLGVGAIGVGVATVLFAGVRPVVEDEALTGLASGRWLGLTSLTWVAVTAVLVAWLVQRHTRLGRYATAIGGAEDIVRLSGVRVDRYKVAAFALAGAFYGLGAVMLTARLGSGVVQAAAGLNFAAITAAVVGGTLLSGGRGGVLPSVVGVFVVTVLANGLVLAGVSPYVQQAVQGVIVVAAVAATTWPLRHRLGVVK